MQDAMQHRNVLIVDDDPSLRRLFRALFAKNYRVREAGSGEDAIEIVADWPPDLVLLDIALPGIDGYETCRRLKAAPATQAAQVIMVSARSARTELANAFAAGADDYLVKPVTPAEILSRVELHFRLRDSQVATEALQRQVDRHHAALKLAANERTEEILAIQDVAVFTLAKVAESRDNETGQHVLRLREYAQRLAQELAFRSPYAKQIDTGFLADLFRSSPLHDIGKVGIPDAVLLKPGRLTADEFEIMKRHTTIGGNILNEAVLQAKGGGFLTMAAEIARFHHERWDGSGYPAGLIAEEIPLAARIVSVADVFDALSSARLYKRAWPSDRAKHSIDTGSGTHFDPVVVASFDNCFDDILRIQHELAEREPAAEDTPPALSLAEYELIEA